MLTTGMLLDRVVTASRAVADTRSRSEKVPVLAALLRELDGADVALAVAYLSGELLGGKIGLGYAAVFGADVAPAAAASLTLAEVGARFDELAALSGAGAGRRRKELLGALLARATEAEQAFLRRLLVGELRQGALEGVMLDAVAVAYGVRPEIVRRAAMLSGKLVSVALAARTEGEAGLAAFHLELFRPLAPMLAQPAPNAREAVSTLGRAILEYKLDGARIQVHKSRDEVRVYTRNLNDVTARVPEVVSAVRAFPASSLILDGEVLSLDAAGTPRPFQTTMSRFGKKLADEQLRAELPLSPFFFDLMHADGEDFIDRPLGERRMALAALAPEAFRIPALVSAEPDEAERFLAQALRAGHEGLLAKSETAPYEAGRRGGAWLKIKQAHALDLVVLAAEWGSGRRHGYLSNIHLGARGSLPGEFVMLGKTFKGMTDALLAWQTARFLELETGRDGHVVLLRPEQVVEIAFDGVQQSSEYPGGLALRFARVKRYRPEKAAHEADTVETVRNIADMSGREKK